MKKLELNMMNTCNRVDSIKKKLNKLILKKRLNVNVEKKKEEKDDMRRTRTLQMMSTLKHGVEELVKTHQTTKVSNSLADLEHDNKMIKKLIANNKKNLTLMVLMPKQNYLYHLKKLCLDVKKLYK